MRLEGKVAIITGAASGMGLAIATRFAAEGLIDLAVTTYGRLNILCSNAGVMDDMRSVGELSDAGWQRVLSINPDSIGQQRTAPFSVLAPAYLNPGDIANLALFLASDESRHINGAIIPADGGWDAV